MFVLIAFTHCSYYTFNSLHNLHSFSFFWVMAWAHACNLFDWWPKCRRFSLYMDITWVFLSAKQHLQIILYLFQPPRQFHPFQQSNIFFRDAIRSCARSGCSVRRIHTLNIKATLEPLQHGWSRRELIQPWRSRSVRTVHHNVLSLCKWSISRHEGAHWFLVSICT